MWRPSAYIRMRKGRPINLPTQTFIQSPQFFFIAHGSVPRAPDMRFLGNFCIVIPNTSCVS